MNDSKQKSRPQNHAPGLMRKPAGKNLNRVCPRSKRFELLSDPSPSLCRGVTEEAKSQKSLL